MTFNNEAPAEHPPPHATGETATPAVWTPLGEAATMGEATTCAGDNESVPGSGSCCSPCNSTAPTLAGENTASERAGLRPSQATSAGAPSARLEQNRQTPPPSKREFPHSIKRAGEILSWNWSCLSGASKLLLHGSGAPNTVCELCTTSACGLLTGSSVEVLTGQEPVSAGMLAELGAAVADPDSSYRPQLRLSTEATVAMALLVAALAPLLAPTGETTLSPRHRAASGLLRAE
eukprot:CAMPEP_0171061232 /NCGR_PEP_ID=MMETSP0766_2-20121228/4303_1 /TAXON_ID=439317 /ORGANISM="Gambierdiscus australes, Strain CAWD 149" /LENGTH=233 /DNA_ID=CAMNT_0011516885 /DNA_START=565 /DNA_END=1268 /DNA_ORIENTATION=-